LYIYHAVEVFIPNIDKNHPAHFSPRESSGLNGTKKVNNSLHSSAETSGDDVEISDHLELIKEMLKNMEQKCEGKIEEIMVV